MHQILHLYAIERLKPREISKLLDIAPSKVYDTVYSAKKAAENLKNPKPVAKPKVKDTLANNKQLLDAMQSFLTERGIYNFTAQQMKTYLAEQQQQHPEQHKFRVPCCKSLQDILHSTFHLSYGKLQQANLKYRDPTFNDKRLWIARLLSQFLYEDALIITVDESNFRSDSLPQKQWGFNERKVI